jgi:epoxide hydrolase
MTDLSPFRIDVPDADLDDLRQRLGRTRWPDQLPDTGWERGVPLAHLQELADHWRTGYDWRLHEAQLNQLPQFTTTIDGQRIHFLHIRSSEPDALALIVNHSWPGSVVEFLDVIGPLSDPRAHGGDPSDAFHLVIPSVPGFAFSGPTAETGWTPNRIASAYAELMARLGYGRYGAQGGDCGALVAPALGRVDPDRVIGVHVNAATVGFIPLGPVDDTTQAEFTAAERARFERLTRFLADGNGFAQIMSTRPQTLAYSLTDSPVGQLAWIAEKFYEWSQHPAAIDRDRMLTNVMLYWLTGTAGSSSRFYYENMHAGEWPQPSRVPTGVAVFTEDVPIRRYAEQFNAIVHWSEFERGGHFAALEAPDLLVGDVRAFFRTLR